MVEGLPTGVEEPWTAGEFLIPACAAAAVALWLLRRRMSLALMRWLFDRQLEMEWEAMPERIMLLRHGEAEHNVHGAELLLADCPDRKPDNLCELTRVGRSQARAAGERIAEILGEGSEISVVVSPFERAQQTLYCVQQMLGRGKVRVRLVHIDPRVREQEFGNFQERKEVPTHKKQAAEVGRFYYRRPTGESGCDVYDRASQFWDSLFCGSLNVQEFFQKPRRFSHKPDDALLIVSHGLTIRILCMAHFSWSPQTFDAVWNPGNCDLWTLRKHPNERRYVFEPKECVPPVMPWATRQVQLVLKAGGEPVPYTLVDYLSLPQPRTSHPEAALRRLVPGHGHDFNPSKLQSAEERQQFIKGVMAKIVDVDANEVASIDWWCGKISGAGKELRTGPATHKHSNRRASLAPRLSKNNLFASPRMSLLNNLRRITSS